MIENVSIPTTVLFALTVLTTIIWFYRATRSKTFLMIIIGWTIIQSIIGFNGIYQNADTIPPNIMLFGTFPALVFIIFTFLTQKGRLFIDNINLKTLTYFHIIRIPVEIVLLLLFYQRLVPINMTPVGTNFDLFSGLTAPLVAYIAFKTGTTNKKLLKWWNVICLLLLFNVVVTAILALPTPFQKISLVQPNVAVLYFPFNLLPTVIVPLVLFGHLIAFRQLRNK